MIALSLIVTGMIALNPIGEGMIALNLIGTRMVALRLISTGMIALKIKGTGMIAPNLKHLKGSHKATWMLAFLENLKVNVRVSANLQNCRHVLGVTQSVLPRTKKIPYFKNVFRFMSEIDLHVVLKSSPSEETSGQFDSSNPIELRQPEQFSSEEIENFIIWNRFALPTISGFHVPNHRMPPW